MEVRINRTEEELLRRGDKNSALESMLARFNRQLQASGLFKELKKHEYYEKPCDKRNRKLREARLRRLRKERKDALYKEATKGKGKPKDKRPISRTKGYR